MSNVSGLKSSRLAVSAFFFLSGLCFASWAARIPDISRSLHLNEGDLGRLLLASPVGSLASLPLAGWLVHRWGSRRTTLAAGGLYAGFLLLLGGASSFWALAGALALFGAAGNVFNIAMNTQAIGVQQLYEGRPIMGTFHGLWSLAGFLGGALGTLMLRLGQGPLPHFALVLGLGLALAVLAYPGTLRHDAGGERPGRLSLRNPDPYLLRLGLLAFCGMLSEGAMFDWAGVYFQKVVRPGPALVTAGYVACMSTMALGRFGSDYLTQRLGPVRTLRLSSALVVAGLLLAVGLPHLLPATGGFLLVGFGIASVVPLTYAAAGRAASVSPGVALTLVSSIGFVGFLLGPPLVGLLGQHFGLRVALAVVAAVASGVGLLASSVNSYQLPVIGRSGERVRANG